VTNLHHIFPVANRAFRFVLKKPCEKMKQAQTSPQLVRRGNSLDNEGKKMKKLLLATTALTLSAGVAAADVALSGDGRMGIVFNDAAENKFRFDSRARVMFTLSGETDTGMAFGGSFRAHTAADAASGNMGMNAATVFISGDFGRLSMGDVAGAVQGAVGDLHGVGLTGLGFTNENVFLQRNFNGGALNSGGTNALYTYSIDGFTLHASIGQLNAGVGSTVFGAAVIADAIEAGLLDPVVDAALIAEISAERVEMAGIGARYEFDGFAIGAGYERAKVDDFTAGHGAIGVEGSFDMITVRATYGRAMNDLKGVFASNNQYGISGSATFDETTVTAFARRDFGKNTHIGLGGSFDLGGGASIVGGVRNTDFNADGVKGQTVADFGVSFSF